MALISDRNIQLTEAVGEGRGLQFLIKLKEVLDTAGWTIIGYGDGVDDSGWRTSGVTTTFPAFPSITGMDDTAWFAAKSASGVHCVFQVINTSGDIQMWVSTAGGYTDDGVGFDTRVGATSPPADEQTPAGYKDFSDNANQKYSIIYDDGGDSFVVFGAFNGFDNMAGFFLKLESFKVGDTAPFVFLWNTRAAIDMWTRTSFTNPATDYLMGWHPDGMGREYCFGKLECDNLNIMDVIPADPVTGDEQLLDNLVVCQVSGAYHVRGVAPIIKQMSGLRSSGDRFDGNRYIGIGAFALDGWNSSDSLES